MKTLLRFTTLLVLCTLLFTTGITSAVADGPTPVGVPVKSPETPGQVTGKPHALLLDKSSTDAAQLEFAIVVNEPQTQAPDEASINNTNTIEAVGTVTVSSVWTTDGSGNAKSTFKPGDSIRWYGYVSNTTGSAKTANFVWSLNTPCGSSTLYSGNLSTAAGTPWWYVGGTVPSNACAGTYTYTLSVTYNGATSSKSVGYTVSGSGSVTVDLAFTTNGSGTAKTIFNSGDTIGWVGNVTNTTGSAKTATFVWSLSGPCGAGTLYSGNLSTGAGTYTWSLNGTIPNCKGSYTYTLSVNYNGSTTSKSASYTVNGSGNVTVDSAFTTNGSGTAKTSFNSGDTIGWAGTVTNTTGSAQTATFVFSQSGPCAAGAMYSGNLSTGTGTYTWSLNGTISSNCQGSYTYTLSVTYNGATTSKSVNYTVADVSGCNTSCQNQLNQSVKLLNGQTVLARNMDGTVPVLALNDAYGKPGQFPFGLTNLGHTMPATPVTSDTSNRYSDLYLAVINEFGVNTNVRYVPSGGYTYCNTYAGDVARAMGNPFPTKAEYSGLKDPATIGFPQLYNWFTTSSSSRGWRSISDLQQIISAVNAGKMVVAMINGHIAVVRPGQSGVTSIKNLRTAQAGATNSVNTTIGERFGGATPIFFIHD